MYVKGVNATTLDDVRTASSTNKSQLYQYFSDKDDQARSALAETFARWEELLAGGFRRMQASGSLDPATDADRLATGVMAALQGGYLLARAAQNVTPMEIALDLALAQVKAQLREA